MGFQLIIAEGKEAGREFLFDQAQVVIGRTSECDVVLYDPGVSRKHARIFAEGAGYFVEDMGSSNGTKVNGEVVQKAKLKDGDAVTLGPVVFNFSSTEMEIADLPTNAVGVQSTRIVSADSLKRSKGKGSALAPEDANPEELQQMGRSRTTTMQAVSKPRVSNPKVPRANGNAAKAAQPEADAAPLARPNRAAPVRAAAPAAGAAGLSAAERARLRREAKGIGGKFRLFWAEASPGKRKAFIGGLGVLGLAALAGTVIAIVGPPWVEPPKKLQEPDVLTRKPIEESFGAGEDVTFQREDQKIFTFEVNAPGDVVVLLHFQCQDISQGEVSITVNGVEVGTAPPDRIGSNERAHEILVPPKVVKRGEVNQVIFDNVKNPPGHETWKIWNVWSEVAGVPNGTPEELIAQAQSAFRRGQQNLERKDIGAENRYQAWRDFRTAWLTLEGHPDPKPDLYAYSRDKMREAQDELDKKCAQLMLEFQGYAAQYDWKSARDTLDHVKEFFPGTDQPCAWKAEMTKAEYGL